MVYDLNYIDSFMTSELVWASVTEFSTNMSTQDAGVLVAIREGSREGGVLTVLRPGEGTPSKGHSGVMSLAWLSSLCSDGDTLYWMWWVERPVLVLVAVRNIVGCFPTPWVGQDGIP